MKKVLVTGASGLLGSHLVEQWRIHGAKVRVILRNPTPVRESFEKCGVEVFQGDLTDPIACRFACEGMDFVTHAAAKVGDWGRWDDFQNDTIEATRQISDAAKHVGVERFLHISSTSAYGHPHDSETPIREDHPLGVNIWRKDHYTLAKVECERLLWKAANTGLPLTVLRPSWLYGPKDRITLKRLLGRLQSGDFRLIGKGNNRFSAVDASEVARAAILASTHPDSQGEAYNLTELREITQIEFFDLISRSLGLPPVRKSVNYHVAFYGAAFLEEWGRRVHPSRPPMLTRYAAWLMGRRLWYDNTKIRQHLGWQPSIDYSDSIQRAVQWFLNEPVVEVRG